ncbi:MAG: hypothetical protein WD018_01240 [Nitrosopumilaceae archaeon]
MLYKDENGKNIQLKPREKMPTINDENREYWRKRTLTYGRKKLFFPAEIKTGTCFFCKKEGRAQRSKTTVLHHVKYNNDDPLEWTIEVCTKCHYHIDQGNKKIIRRHFAPRDFARSVDKEAERIAFKNMSHEEMMRKYVRGYAENFPKN